MTPSTDSSVCDSTEGWGTDRPQVSPMRCTTSACGKAILVGEHAVIYGARAIAIPVSSMRIYLHVERNESGQSELLLDGHSVSDHLVGLVEEATRNLGLPHLAVTVRGSSTMLIGAGLGSSAALSIALLRALSALSGRRLSDSVMATEANLLERRFHHRPSGLDAAVVSYEVPVSFQRHSGCQRLTIARPDTGAKATATARWTFAVLDSRERSSTAAMVRHSASFFQGTNGQRRVQAFQDLADTVQSGLKAGDTLSVGEAMDQAHRLLAEIGLVSDELERVISVAKSIGVVGAKLTGAGGGGCALALLDPHQATQQLVALKQHLGKSRVYEVTLP